jgi:prepilin-type N-terminal cleavage/methylation domain-containing protein
MKIIKQIKHTQLLASKGFSLIELIIVMVILGIIVAASSSRLRDITVNARVNSAANQITSDIDQAKSMSMGRRKQIKFVFNQNNETYTVYEENILFTDYPGSVDGVMSLSDTNSSGVDITAINLNGSNTLTFDKWGTCLQGGTIILNQNKEIHVKKITGFWEIINS